MTLTIELAGDLAGILALTANGKKPATMSRDGLASNVGCGGTQPPLPNYDHHPLTAGGRHMRNLCGEL